MAILEKAQELMKSKNSEFPLGKPKPLGFSNSFTTVDNPILLEKSKEAGINLGSNDDKIDLNINTIKMETDELSSFHSDHPDVLLPLDLSLREEDFRDPIVQTIMACTGINIFPIAVINVGMESLD
jgi:hypothetical protein